MGILALCVCVCACLRACVRACVLTYVLDVCDGRGADDQCVAGHRVLGQLGLGRVVQVGLFCQTWTHMHTRTRTSTRTHTHAHTHIHTHTKPGSHVSAQ